MPRQNRRPAPSPAAVIGGEGPRGAEAVLARERGRERRGGRGAGHGLHEGRQPHRGGGAAAAAADPRQRCGHLASGRVGR